MKIPSADVQQKAAKHIASTFSLYEDLMMPRKEQLLKVYDEYSTFVEPTENEWSTSFKVNKAHEVVENVLPSLTAKDPRWIATVRDLSSFPDSDEVAALKQQNQSPLGDYQEQVLQKKSEEASKQSSALQDYLSYLFDEYHMMDRLELWAKNGVVDGKGYVQVSYKYEIDRTVDRKMKKDADGNMILDENGEPELDDESEDIIAGEHPTVDLIDWTDLYYDSRIINAEDRPAWIRIKENVRLADILRYKDRYFNLDELKAVARASKGSAKNGSKDNFKEAIKSIQGLNQDNAAPIDENSLTCRYYYGIFNETEDPLKETIYEIVTVNDMLVIRMEKLSKIPIEEWKCFPDPKSAHAVGFVEPILGLQNEFNFKKNSASEYINKAIRRQRLWSPNSGIDPHTLNDPIITTTRDAPTALLNIPELPFNTLDSSYFNEQNDIERQLQGLTHTVDTSNPNNQQALTNTATGAKIKFFESNKVLDAVRKRWERAMERLAYKLIDCTFEHMEDNIVFKKTKSEGYWYMNKEALRDALRKYRIRVEVASSSYSDTEGRRDDALAYMTIAQQVDAQFAAQQSPQRVDFRKIFEDITSTFEKKDVNKYLTMPSMNPLNQMAQMAGPTSPMQQPQQKPTSAESLTKSVVGNILPQ